VRYLILLITDSNYVEKTISCMRDLAATKSSDRIDFEIVGIDLKEDEKDSIRRCCLNPVSIFEDSFPDWSRLRSHPRDYASGCRALHIRRILSSGHEDYEFLMYSDVDYMYDPEFDLDYISQSFKNHKIMLRSAAVLDRRFLPDNQAWRASFSIFQGTNKQKIEVDFWQKECEDFSGNAGLIFFKFDNEINFLADRWHKDIEKAEWIFPCDQTTLINILREEIPKNKFLWRAIPRTVYRNFYHEQFSRFLLKGVTAKRSNQQIDEILDFLRSSGMKYE